MLQPAALSLTTLDTSYYYFLPASAATATPCTQSHIAATTGHGRS